MPGTNDVEFARTIPRTTLFIFTTAFSQYAADSYEVDAMDYLVKPVKPERFRRAVENALSYHYFVDVQGAQYPRRGRERLYIYQVPPPVFQGGVA